MALTSKAYRLFHLAYPVVVLAPVPARADFFDDARRTFQTDIPHFFQDDIPCAFGGQPTSHTKTSCKSPDHPAKRTTDPAKRTTGKDRDPAAVRPDETHSDETHEVQDPSPSSDR
jgi:hypothetical protein